MISGVMLTCLVIAVSDGDTLKVRCGVLNAYEQRTIRVSAIDAPEIGQAFGQRAKQALSNLCIHQQAGIKPVATDRYGRTVADVECNKTDVGKHMVATGFAWVYDKYSKGYGHLYALQEASQVAKRGLWADLGTSQAPVPPWDWRHTKRTAHLNN